MTEVQIKLDVFQTYQFDFNYKKCFVEREHVNSDRVGEHTVPEGLETGEYYVDTYDYYDNFDSTVLVVLATKKVDADSQTVDEPIPVSSLNGITVYGKIYICENRYDLDGLLYWYVHNEYSGGTDSITSMYFVPRKCINWNDVRYKVMYDADIKEYSSKYPLIYNYTFAKPTSLDGYVPKNKKLLTFPYCFLVASNNNGNNNVYKYEKFIGNNCVFDFSCIPTPGASIKMSPSLYTQNQGYDEDEGLIAGKFPFMNWASQAYNEWLARNSLNLTGQFVVGTIQTVASASTGNALGVVDGLTNTLNVAKQMYDHKMLPDSSHGNINGADINTAQDQNGFYFYQKSINNEFARIIDDFFTKFGYKVNRLKEPNIFGRQFYNYVKTIDAIVEGDNIPEKYLNEYREMLNKGITFWHTTEQFLNYNVNNVIV